MRDDTATLRPLDARAADPALRAGDRLLAEAARRVMRAPQGKVAMALHLSRVGAPRPHQARVAMALMQDTAQRCGGQVFARRNGDLAMLCGSGERTGGAPLRLMDALGRLFGGDGPEDLCSVWRLEDSGAAFLDWAKDGAAGPSGAGQAPAGAPANSLASRDAGAAARLTALSARIMAADLRTLLAVGVAVPAEGDGAPPALRSLTTRLENAAESDRAVLQDSLAADILAGQVAPRLVGFLAALAAGRSWLLRDLPLHVTLGPEAILSPAFAALAELPGTSLCIDMPAAYAAKNPAAARLARRVLDLAGFGFALTGLDAATLPALRPDALRPDRIRLRWSEDLPQSGDSIRRLGPERLVLDGADGPDAIHWARQAGIPLVSGPAVEAHRAERRMAGCHGAAACSAAQCAARAAALAPRVRQGCGNPGLLAQAA